MASARAELVQLVLDWGSDVNCRSEEPKRTTALHEALTVRDFPVVQLLLEARANVDTQALRATARTGNLDLVRSLIQRLPIAVADTAEIECITLYGATENGDVTVVEQLLSQGDKIDALPCTRETCPGGIRGSVLQASIENAENMVFRMLLAAGANVNLVAHGETPLCTAVRNENWDMFITLPSHGANPSPWNVRVTPLAIAASTGALSILPHYPSGWPRRQS